MNNEPTLGRLNTAFFSFISPHFSYIHDVGSYLFLGGVGVGIVWLVLSPPEFPYQLAKELADGYNLKHLLSTVVQILKGSLI